MRWLLVSPIAVTQGLIPAGMVVDDAVEPALYAALRDSGATLRPLPDPMLERVADLVAARRRAGAPSPADLQVLATLAGRIAAPDEDVLLPFVGASVTTRAIQATYEGGMVRVHRPIRFTRVAVRLTAATTVGATLRLLIGQIPGGCVQGVGEFVTDVRFTIAGAGAQTVVMTLPSAKELEPGIAFAFVARTGVLSGMTIRTWTTGSLDLLTANLAPNSVPIAVQSIFPGALDPPATFTVPAAFAAPSVNSPIPVVRLLP